MSSNEVCLSAYLSGFELEGTTSNGSTIYVSVLDGWDEGADLDVPSIPRAGHGEFGIAGYMRARYPVLEGRVESPDHKSMLEAKRELGAVLASGGFGELVIEHAAEAGVVLWATVQRESRPRFVDVTPTIFDWRFQLRAPDSFRYGLASTATTGFATSPEGAGLVFPLFDPAGVLDFGPVPDSDGTATITNEGNAPAFPVFSIDGPTPAGGFRIVDLATGQRITFLGDVPAGSTLVMDASDGSVVINGGPSRLGETIVTRWPSIAPGGSSTYQFAPESSASAATLTVSVYNTYY